METLELFNPTIWSYGFAGLIFAAFVARLLLGWRGGLPAQLVLAAVVASALWSMAVIGATESQRTDWWIVAGVLDAARFAGWIAFLLCLLGQWESVPLGVLGARKNPWWLVGTSALIIVTVLFPAPAPWLALSADRGFPIDFLARLGIAILGLTLTEQLYRRTPEDRHWAIKPLIIGFSGMFAFDLLMYAEAVLFRYIDPGMAAARGVAHGVVVLLVAMATARNTAWTMDLHVSRSLVFQSTAVMIAGIGLLVVAAAGYWVRVFGGGWGATLQITLVFSATLCIAALSLSGRLRSRLRVFINQNLFSYRYDYRKEWLRFTEVLGTSESGEKLHEKVVQSIGNLVESGGGAVWLARGNAYWQVAQINMAEVTEPEPVSSPFATFLHRTGWVLQLDEVRASPERFSTLAVPSWLTNLENAWLVIPLPDATSTIGFVVLARPLAPIDINWEVRDLLKTASRQAAAYLAQFRANEALLEAEKFSAFNRMSAFVVHDLKNLIAQLALLLKNAERHRDNPEFQRDMLETIEHVVQRMTHLTLQLHTGATPSSQPKAVDIRQVIERIVQAKRDYPVAVTVESGAALKVVAHEEQIERVIGHIVQNAIDATREKHGQVSVRARAEREYAVIEVRDDGLGMSEEFIRERLFRPFQTTKQQGMGVGMNESAQYINGIGGRIQVESVMDSGTCFRVFLRLAADTGPAISNQKSQ